MIADWSKIRWLLVDAAKHLKNLFDQRKACLCQSTWRFFQKKHSNGSFSKLQSFGAVSDEQLLRLIAEGTNGNTARATSMWLRVVSEYRQEKGFELSFATCTAEELAAFLEKFFAEVRPQKDGEYSKSSYLAARAPIQRHLRIVKRPFNIFTDEAFVQANKVLDCILKWHKTLGLEKQTKHKEPISLDDLAKK